MVKFPEGRTHKCTELPKSWCPMAGLGDFAGWEISWAAFVPGSHVGLWLVWQLYFLVFMGLGITSIQEVGIKFLARIKWNEACERCITMLNFTKSAGEFFHNLVICREKRSSWYAQWIASGQIRSLLMKSAGFNAYTKRSRNNARNWQYNIQERRHELLFFVTSLMNRETRHG